MTPEQLKVSILQRAMEGKLVPQDPNDEPASDLLKRIKAEKEKLIKEGKIKRDKNETEIFRGDDGLHYEKLPDGSVRQIDVPFEIPESWGWVRLNNIIDVRDGTHETPKYVQDGVPLLTSKNLVNGKLVKEPSKLISLAESNEINKRSKVEENDILLAMIGTIGNPVLVSKVDYQFSVKNMAILKQISTINMEFVYYFIIYFSTELKNMSSGAVQNFVSLKQLRNIFFPVPPITEQNRIIVQIKKLLILIDRYSFLYNSLEKKNRTFPEKLRKSILQYAMQGKLVPQDATDEPVEVLLEKIREEKQKLFEEGKLKKKDLQESIIYQGDDSSYKHIPKSWVLTTLGNVGFWRSGATPSRSNPLYFGGDIPWLKTGDLNDGYIYHIPENITALAVKETSVKLIPSDSVLIAMYGATIGKIGILTFPATTNQACCACTPYNILNNQYLFWYLRFSRDKFIEMAEGGAQPNISKEKIVGFPIALPPIREQRKIVNKIECLLDKVSLL